MHIVRNPLFSLPLTFKYRAKLINSTLDKWIALFNPLNISNFNSRMPWIEQLDWGKKNPAVFSLSCAKMITSFSEVLWKQRKWLLPTLDFRVFCKVYMHKTINWHSVHGEVYCKLKQMTNINDSIKNCNLFM